MYAVKMVPGMQPPKMDSQPPSTFVIRDSIEDAADIELWCNGLYSLEVDGPGEGSFSACVLLPLNHRAQPLSSSIMSCTTAAARPTRGCWRRSRPTASRTKFRTAS